VVPKSSRKRLKVVRVSAPEVALAALEEFESAQWAKWIETRIHAVYSPGNPYSQFAFKFPDLGITESDSIFDSLAQLLRQLSPLARDQFKEGLAELAGRWREGNEPKGAYAVLLEFIALSQAWQAVPVLVDKAIAREIETASLYDLIAILKGMSNAPVAFAESLRLAKFNGVPSAWVVDLLEAAIQAAPRNWLLSFLDLKDRLEACAVELMPQRYGPAEIGQRIWEFCRNGVVTKEDLLKGFPTLATLSEKSKIVDAIRLWVCNEEPDAHYAFEWVNNEFEDENYRQMQLDEYWNDAVSNPNDL